VNGGHPIPISVIDTNYFIDPVELGQDFLPIKIPAFSPECLFCGQPDHHQLHISQLLFNIQ
jgi:NADPH-dependent 7-cyano-7-deazaguanine reductase QueF